MMYYTEKNIDDGDVAGASQTTLIPPPEPAPPATAQETATPEAPRRGGVHAHAHHGHHGGNHGRRGGRHGGHHGGHHGGGGGGGFWAGNHHHHHDRGHGRRHGRRHGSSSSSSSDSSDSSSSSDSETSDTEHEPIPSDDARARAKAEYKQLKAAIKRARKAEKTEARTRRGDQRRAARDVQGVEAHVARLARRTMEGLVHRPARFTLSTLRDVSAAFDALYGLSEAVLGGRARNGVRGEEEGARDEQDAATVRPRADVQVSPDGNSFIITVDLPGVRREDVSVELGPEHCSFVVEGTVSRGGDQANINPIRSERAFVRGARFERTVWLPGFVDGEGIQAKLNEGVLVVTANKVKETAGRKIDIL